LLLTPFALVSLYEHRKRLVPQGRRVSGFQKTAPERQNVNVQTKFISEITSGDEISPEKDLEPFNAENILA